MEPKNNTCLFVAHGLQKWTVRRTLCPAGYASVAHKKLHDTLPFVLDHG